MCIDIKNNNNLSVYVSIFALATIHHKHLIKKEKNILQLKQERSDSYQQYHSEAKAHINNTIAKRTLTSTPEGHNGTFF